MVAGAGCHPALAVLRAATHEHEANPAPLHEVQKHRLCCWLLRLLPAAYIEHEDEAAMPE